MRGAAARTSGSKKLATLAAVAEKGSPLQRTSSLPSPAAGAAGAVPPPPTREAIAPNPAPRATGPAVAIFDGGSAPGSGPLGTAGRHSGDPTEEADAARGEPTADKPGERFGDADGSRAPCSASSPGSTSVAPPPSAAPSPPPSPPPPSPPAQSPGTASGSDCGALALLQAAGGA